MFATPARLDHLLVIMRESSEARPPLLAAYTVPFLVFMAGLALVEAIRWLSGDTDSFWLKRPEYWVYPLQTVACGAAVIFYWKHYDFSGRGGWFLAVIGGALALGVWLSPQILFGAAPRLEGFDPTVFSQSPELFWLTVLGRFARLVIIVPIIEEIFWRGFLMRYLIREDFWNVKLGTYAPLAFFGVAGVFMLAHTMADWPAAFLTGLIFNAIMLRTKNIPACILAHALTNLGLGLYIMRTGQWGFW